MLKKLLLHIKDIEKGFSDKKVLRQISLEINGGEVLGLVGPNGSGKTTMIRTILDFYKPEKGFITMMDIDCNKHFENIGHKIGVMLESSGMYPLLTAKEYLELFGHLWSIPKEQLTIAVDDVLEKTGLTNVKDRKINTFSKGMIQRLAFGRAILNHPNLLILDEPFDGIDVEAKKNLMNLITSMRKEGMGVLITSHNLKEVDEICTRIVFIKNGHIVHDGSLDEIREMYRENALFHVFFQSDVDDSRIKTLFPNDNYDSEKKILHVRLTSQNTKEKIMNTIFNQKIQIKEAFEEYKNIEDIYMDFMKAN